MSAGRFKIYPIKRRRQWREILYLTFLSLPGPGQGLPCSPVTAHICAWTPAVEDAAAAAGNGAAPCIICRVLAERYGTLVPSDLRWGPCQYNLISILLNNTQYNIILVLSILHNTTSAISILQRSFQYYSILQRSFQYYPILQRHFQYYSILHNTTMSILLNTTIIYFFNATQYYIFLLNQYYSILLNTTKWLYQYYSIILNTTWAHPILQ